MALATSYTDLELVEYMAAELGTVASTLGLVIADGDYDHALASVLRAYGGVTEADEATDMEKLEALARREAWRLALNATADYYDFSADGGRYDRSQIHEHCADQLALAEVEAQQYDDSYAVGKGTMTWDYNPYSAEGDS